MRYQRMRKPAGELRVGDQFENRLCYCLACQLEPAEMVRIDHILPMVWSGEFEGNRFENTPTLAIYQDGEFVRTMDAEADVILWRDKTCEDSGR